MEQEKYKDWHILETIPLGWVVDKTAGSPIANSVFITNGKSPLKGQKRAILKINSNPIKYESKPLIIKHKVKEDLSDFVFPAKTVNQLARKKFQELLLNEIRFDLMVCEVEDWCKKQYIKELQSLLNNIDVSRKRKKVVNKDFKLQLDIFDVIPK
ncbi:hypothetical protein LNJ06_09510 [Tenacibaculum finnmarkense genomovar ulcerans]|uniref:hypothetical protein n=1 Tax=Tenacibaculum finnmarkense TaxID=2781243 RepID=UPI001E285564|nr:hypothetical protein [Tenacibaculum finnmarkense]MCD8430404.1 hypothetical protein [Tenacibaculum finnmarkense genomovar ulcerans]